MGSENFPVNLVVFSHKLCWRDNRSPSGFSPQMADFPKQIGAISHLFKQTTLIILLSKGETPEQTEPLLGNNLIVHPLPELAGRTLMRKIRFLFWSLKYSFEYSRIAKRADVVHAIVPGDVGTLGICVALVQGKPLLVRHCGNWAQPRTFYERLLIRLLEFIAGGKNMILATGAAQQQPSSRNPNIKWIFSTSLSETEMIASGRKRSLPSGAKKLIIACRQEPDKGTAFVIDSLPLILARYPEVTLDVVGDGSALSALKRQVENLCLECQVVFYGKLSHTTTLQRIEQADLFCFPTRASEGFPKVVLEALACGIPVIASSVSAIPVLLSEGGGISLDAPNPEQLAQAVIDLFSNPAHYKSMSVCALKTASQYSLENWQDSIRQELQLHWNDLLLTNHA